MISRTKCANFGAKHTFSYSTWSLATPEELEAGLKNWRTLVEEGKAEQCVAKCEEQRGRLGQTTSVVAVKPGGGAKTDQSC